MKDEQGKSEKCLLLTKAVWRNSNPAFSHKLTPCRLQTNKKTVALFKIND